MRRLREPTAEAGPALARVAAIAALTLAAAAVVLLLAGARSDYRITAVFDDVRGLIPGGEVKAGGVDVGRVDSISFGPDGLPRVQMTISGDFRLRQGAFAGIRLASNVGGTNRYVDLTQGTGPELPDGATLGPSRTDQPVDLDTALSALDPRTRRAAGRILAALDRATRNRGADLARALRRSGTALGQVADLLGEVNSDRAALRAVVANARTVVGAVARSPGDLAATADRTAALLAATADRQAALARTSRLVGPALAAARHLLARLHAAVPGLRGLVADARPAVAQLKPTARALAPALAALEPLLGQARGLIREAPGELRRLRPALAATLRILPDLRPALGRLGPMLDVLRVWTPEVVSFFTLGGDLTSTYDANGNLVRVSSVAIQTPRHTNPVGPGSDRPGLVRRPFYRLPGALEGDPWRRYYRSFIGGAKPVGRYLEPSP